MWETVKELNLSNIDAGNIENIGINIFSGENDRFPDITKWNKEIGKKK
jgi:hypothetical protein